MPLIEKHENIIVLSDPSTGATDITKRGSHFAVSFNTPIQIPKGAQNCSISVESANVWFVQPNIIKGENMFYLVINGEEKSYEIPVGLYNVSLLKQKIKELLSDNADKVVMGANDATNKITFTFSEAGYVIRFKEDSPCVVLGYDVGDYEAGYEAPPVEELPEATEPEPEPEPELYSPSYPNTIEAPNTASFNTLEYYLIHSTIVDGKGININNVTNSTIAKVVINNKAGKQVLYSPTNPIHVGATHLAGSSVRRVEFWITDQNDKPIDCFNEFWGCTLVIKYQEPFIIQQRR